MTLTRAAKLFTSTSSLGGATHRDDTKDVFFTCVPPGPRRVSAAFRAKLKYKVKRIYMRPERPGARLVERGEREVPPRDQKWWVHSERFSGIKKETGQNEDNVDSVDVILGGAKIPLIIRDLAILGDLNSYLWAN